MAQRKRVPEKPPKGTRRPTPGMLGTGMAYGAAKALQGRGQQLAKQECIAEGGKWVNGKCVYR